MVEIVDTDDGFRLVMYAVLPDGSRFAIGAADHLIGTQTPIGIGFDEPEFIGTIEAAEVVDDGKAIKMTVKLENMPPELAEMLDNPGFIH